MVARRTSRHLRNFVEAGRLNVVESQGSPRHRRDGDAARGSDLHTPSWFRPCLGAIHLLIRRNNSLFCL
jgi:hypothetical protein